MLNDFNTSYYNQQKLGSTLEKYLIQPKKVVTDPVEDVPYNPEVMPFTLWLYVGKSCFPARTGAWDMLG